MNTLKKIVLLACISAIFVTCKKETLAPGAVEGQPVFSFSGNINGNTINWQAGVNNYYMYSSFNQDTVVNNKGVYNFVGTLQNTATNKNSIQIILDDDTIVARSANSNISKSITPAAYYYSIPGGNEIWDSVVFLPKVYYGGTPSLTYSFGDGNLLTTQSNLPITHIYKNPQGAYLTSLTAGFSSGFPRTIKTANIIYANKTITPAITVDSISYTIAWDSTHSHNVGTYTAHISGGLPAYTYVWDIQNSADSTVSSNTSATTSHTYTFEPADTTTISIAVKDTSKHIATFSYVIYDSNVSANRVAYSTSSLAKMPNPYSLSTVTINYIDGYGNKFTSNNLNQPPLSTFQVVSVSNYQNNMNNNPTKMLKITFNCMLYNGLNAIPASGTAIIAVAYQ